MADKPERDPDPLTDAMRWWAALLQSSLAPDRAKMGPIWREWTAEAGALGAPNLTPGSTMKKWLQWPDGSRIRWYRGSEMATHLDRFGKRTYLMVAPGR